MEDFRLGGLVAGLLARPAGWGVSARLQRVASNCSVALPELIRLAAPITQVKLESGCREEGLRRLYWAASIVVEVAAVDGTEVAVEVRTPARIKPLVAEAVVRVMWRLAATWSEGRMRRMRIMQPCPPLDLAVRCHRPEPPVPSSSNTFTRWSDAHIGDHRNPGGGSTARG